MDLENDRKRQRKVSKATQWLNGLKVNNSQNHFT